MDNWMTWLRPCAVTCLVVAIAIMAAAGAPRAAPDVQVVDGDSYIVNGVHIRLQAIHCPEYDEPGGAKAEMVAREIVRRAHILTCEPTGERSYHREVATCTVGGWNSDPNVRMDLGRLLIQSGVCTVCRRYDRTDRYVADAAANPWRGSIPSYCRQR